MSSQLIPNFIYFRFCHKTIPVIQKIIVLWTNIGPRNLSVNTESSYDQSRENYKQHFQAKTLKSHCFHYNTTMRNSITGYVFNK